MNFTNFASTVYPFLEIEPFHEVYYNTLGARRYPQAHYHNATATRQVGRCYHPTTRLSAWLKPRYAYSDSLLLRRTRLKVQPPSTAHIGERGVYPNLPRHNHKARSEARQLYPHLRRGGDYRARWRTTLGWSRRLAHGQPSGLLYP